MSIVQTVLVFVCIPLGIVLLLGAFSMGPSLARAPRYRPGSGWDFKPVWYLPHRSQTEALSAGHVAPAEPGQHGSAPAIANPVKASGGASGEW